MATGTLLEAGRHIALRNANVISAAAPIDILPLSPDDEGNGRNVRSATEGQRGDGFPEATQYPLPALPRHWTVHPALWLWPAIAEPPAPCRNRRDLSAGVLRRADLFPQPGKPAHRPKRPLQWHARTRPSRLPPQRSQPAPGGDAARCRI